MKRRILFLTVLTLVLALILPSCGQKSVERLEIAGGLEYVYEVGATPDFSGVTVNVIYNDGTSIVVGADQLTFGQLDTSVAGQKDLTISYGDEKTITVKVTVKAAGSGNEGGDNEDDENDGVGYTVWGVDYDANLKAFVASNGNKLNFRGDTNNNYKVGSINPFRFTLNVITDDAAITSYESLSKVYLVDGNVETLLEGDALAQYVAVNEAAGHNSFDFTDAAIGKTFRLETRPLLGVEEGYEADCTKSLTVDVVDAYNVYEAWELNLITNDPDDLIGNTTTSQLTAVTAFLSNNGLVRPENLKGVVLHKSFTPEISDLPEEYFYTLPVDVPYQYTDKAGVTHDAVWSMGTQFFYDIIGVYNLTLNDDAPEFSIYGNYFSIFTNKLPSVAPKGYGYNENELSGAELIRFDTARELIVANGHEKYKANVYGLNLRDNDGSDDDNSAALRHKLGLLAFKTFRCTTTLDQVNIHSYFISLHVNRDCQTVTLNDCDFYNAWNNHIMTWSDNDIDSNSVTTTHANHTHITLNITGDSRIAKCGGPVIINMHHQAEYAAQNESCVEVNIAEGTIIYSYVAGQEAWFTANNATNIAMQIKALNALTALGGGQYLTTLPNSGNTTFFNAIMVNMAYVQDASSVFSSNDLDGTLVFGDYKLLEMNDTAGNFGDAIVSAIASHPTLGKAPIFKSSNGTVALGLVGGSTQGVNPFTGQAAVGTALGVQNGVAIVLPDGLYELDPTNAALPLKPASENIYKGEYITLYYNNIGIVFGYNESNITEY